MELLVYHLKGLAVFQLIWNHGDLSFWESHSYNAFQCHAFLLNLLKFNCMDHVLSELVP
jgi:hypothetical protein